MVYDAGSGTTGNYNTVIGGTPTPSFGAVTQGVDPRAQPVLGLRFASGLVDLVVCIVISAAILAPLFVLVESTADTPASTDFLFLVLPLLWAAALFAYGWLMDWRYGGTLGKLATGTRVTDLDSRPISLSRSLGRYAGTILTGLFVPFFLGYLMVFMTARRQTLHDLMAGKLVFTKADLVADRAAVFS